MVSDSNNKKRLEVFTRITQIATGISVILGIILGLFGLYDTKQQAELSLKSLRLSSLEHINTVIENDNRAREKIGKFLALLNKERIPPSSELLNKYGTGSAAYLSEELRAFREIGRHYERMGTIIRLGYLDFPFIYEVIPFPDEFWDSTEKLRQTIQSNWSGRGKGLNDFWKNFSWLREEYKKKRLSDG